MTYRNLLVQVDESRSCARRVELAGELAAAHDAHLTGVYIVSEPSPASFVHPYLPPDLTVSLQQEMRARADAALARFAEVAGRNQVAFESRVDRVLYTEIAEALATHARYVDLVILGQFDPDDPAAEPRYLPEQVILGCGRAALVVPWDVDATAERCAEVLSDPDALRAHLELLRQAAAPLTWGRTARDLLALYREAIDAPPRDARGVVAELADLKLRLRDLEERGTYDPETLALVGQGGAIPPDLRRPLLAIAHRPLMRNLFFGPLRALYRLARLGRRSR